MARNLYWLLSTHFLLTEHASGRGWGFDIRDLKDIRLKDLFNIRRHLHCHVLHWGEVIHAGWHEDACSYKKKDLYSRFFVIIILFKLYFFFNFNLLTIMLLSVGILRFTQYTTSTFVTTTFIWGIAMDCRQLCLRLATEMCL